MQWWLFGYNFEYSLGKKMYVIAPGYEYIDNYQTDLLGTSSSRVSCNVVHGGGCTPHSTNIAVKEKRTTLNTFQDVSTLQQLIDLRINEALTLHIKGESENAISSDHNDRAIALPKNDHPTAYKSIIAEPDREEFVFDTNQYIAVLPIDPFTHDKDDEEACIDRVSASGNRLSQNYQTLDRRTMEPKEERFDYLPVGNSMDISETNFDKGNTTGNRMSQAYQTLDWKTME